MSCCSRPKKEEEHSHSHSHSSCCGSHSHKDHSHEHSHSHSHSHGDSCCSAPKKSNESAKKISRQMTIEEILGMFPYKAQKLSQEITNAGLHCVGCHAAVWETLEGGMLSHGKTEEQIDELVRRLNVLLEEPIDQSSICITSRGAAKFLEILNDEGKQGWGMRFAEEMAGCNGFEYVLDFSEKAEADDQVFVSNGIEIHVKKAMVPRLLGSEIDFVDGLRGSGFKISNPNVRSSCGCGSSHNY
ncbi:iron-sulfur cluster assembly accessory protein [Candidatus Protochlamydia phocaeensis]|uniref:iron-sulfur cluster assembly accessory protein n=1 Tax=Candidatus Protochlamydia phocaeensis TaxID=1414722 RepID=UPI0009AED93E|nr:iron-sulfur cluster assembly accessory protein [Candidatus Protochlamydia phocaeensis]